ncbi:hypothetical protein HPF78_1224, partial [Helicobacter pylori]
MGRFVVSKKK